MHVSFSSKRRETTRNRFVITGYMQFPSTLIRGRLIQRYKRFLADIELEDGSVITAHCPNPGAMLGLNMPGLTVWLAKSDSPTRKLPYTLQLVEVESPTDGKLTVIGIDTMHPNRIVAEALEAGWIPELARYESMRREVKYGEASRVDFLLTGEGRPDCWLEIKNCHLSRGGGLAEFPDCVAARSSRHLRELAAMAAKGDRAVVLFVVQRTDCDRFAACAELDPVFARTLGEVAAQGVEVLAYACDIDREQVVLRRKLEWVG